MSRRISLGDSSADFPAMWNDLMDELEADHAEQQRTNERLSGLVRSLSEAVSLQDANLERATRALWWGVVTTIALAVAALIVALVSATASAPTPTPTVTVTAPPVTLPPRTVYVERADRSQNRAIPQATERGSKPSGTWLALARCESGANPRANTGNGYYGAFQISESTWVGYRGREKYAPMPHQATWVQQQYVAWRVWRKQGWSAYPGCGRKLGHPAMPAVERP